jgi:hypothetical protein
MRQEPFQSKAGFRGAPDMHQQLATVFIEYFATNRAAGGLRDYYGVQVDRVVTQFRPHAQTKGISASAVEVDVRSGSEFAWISGDDCC